MLEIEAKIKIDDFSPIRSRLKALDAQLIGQHHETNIFLDTPDKKLLSADSGLRLRRNHNFQNNKTQFVLTFKGPRLPGQVKARQEYETEVSSDENTLSLLSCLGFVPTLRFEKNRESWKLGDCKVELDDLPKLGRFVEIEGPDEARVLEVRGLLGLGSEPMIHESYAALLANL